MFYNAKNDVLEYENTIVDYISFGEGNEDLVFIPGLGEGLNSISGYAVPFSLMYKVYAKDYRVHVFSRRKEMPENFSTEDMANDIIKHMNELNIEKANIVGVSQGGMIAEYIAINAPEKVDKLVLVVTVARKNETLENCVKNWIELAKVEDYKVEFDEVILEDVNFELSEACVKHPTLSTQFASVNFNILSVNVFKSLKLLKDLVSNRSFFL